MIYGIGILAISVALSAGYSWLLQSVHDIYSPDFIWVTVVVGNIFVGATMAALAAVGLIEWAAVGWLVAVNVAWGVPVIAWQIGQAVRRHKDRGL